MSQSEFTPLYNKITTDIKKTSHDFKAFKHNIYNEIHTSDIITGIGGFEKYIYNKINQIPKNTIWYTIYLVLRFIFITFWNFMVVFLPLLLAIAIVGYFRYSPSWLGKTTRYLLKSIIETPYELKPPG
jgi:hypothetical protein